MALLFCPAFDFATRNGHLLILTRNYKNKRLASPQSEEFSPSINFDPSSPKLPFLSKPIMYIVLVLLNTVIIVTKYP